jgi:hypothetical protein
MWLRCRVRKKTDIKMNNQVLKSREEHNRAIVKSMEHAVGVQLAPKLVVQPAGTQQASRDTSWSTMRRGASTQQFKSPTQKIASKREKASSDGRGRALRRASSTVAAAVWARASQRRGRGCSGGGGGWTH